MHGKNGSPFSIHLPNVPSFSHLSLPLTIILTLSLSYCRLLKYIPIQETSIEPSNQSVLGKAHSLIDLHWMRVISTKGYLGCIYIIIERLIGVQFGQLTTQIAVLV